MPTDISNALGTQRQFTPQPDRQYQGRYASIEATTVNPTISKSVQLAENLSMLDRAMQNYMVSHEKYLNDTGLTQAERYINSLSAEDKEKLNTIDGAIQAGFVDDTSNPYFKAYAEKLRGGFLGAKVKQLYDEKYSMSPARTMEEEQQRYYNFVNKWKESNLAGNNAPVNVTAFDSGFYENQAVNQIKLADSWNTRKHEDDIVVTMASAQSKLGDIIENSPTLLNDNGAMTKAVQEVFNEIRLMGLPPQYRQKLLDDFSTQLVQTGHLDSTRLEQMMDNIIVQTSIDGTTTKASDILNMQTYKTFASQFNRQFMSKEKEDRRKTFVNKKDRAGLLQWLEDTRKNDPDKALEVQQEVSKAFAEIDQKEHEEKAIARAKLAGRMSSSKGEIKTQNTLGAINTWLNGNIMYNGQTISSLNIDKDTLNKVATPMLFKFMGENNPEKASRLMAMPQLSALRNDISADLVYQLDVITPDNVDNLNGNVLGLLRFMTYNPNTVEHLFNRDIADRASVLKSLFDLHNGDMSLTLKDFATYNTVDPEVRKGYKEQVKNMILKTAYTADGAIHLTEDDGGTNSYYPTTSIQIAGNPEFEGAMTNLATLFCTQGLSVYNAVNKAGSIIANNFLVYHTGAFPKGVALDNCYGATEWQNEVYFRRALAQGCYETSADDAQNVDVSYDRRNQMFYFTHSGTNMSTHISLEKVREIARNLWSDGVLSYGENQQYYDNEPTELQKEREQKQYTTYESMYKNLF